MERGARETQAVVPWGPDGCTGDDPDVTRLVAVTTAQAQGRLPAIIGSALVEVLRHGPAMHGFGGSYDGWGLLQGGLRVLPGIGGGLYSFGAETRVLESVLSDPELPECAAVPAEVALRLTHARHFVCLSELCSAADFRVGHERQQSVERLAGIASALGVRTRCVASPGVRGPRIDELLRSVLLQHAGSAIVFNAAWPGGRETMAAALKGMRLVIANRPVFGSAVAVDSVEELEPVHPGISNAVLGPKAVLFADASVVAAPGGHPPRPVDSRRPHDSVLGAVGLITQEVKAVSIEIRHRPPEQEVEHGDDRGGDLAAAG